MWKGVLSAVLFVGCVWMTGGLKCLRCLDTGVEGPCVHDYEGLVDATQGDFNNGSRSYYKECPDGTFRGIINNYCVIEEFYLGGELKSFIRDCSDGKNFSFTGLVSNPKLNDIVPNNYTTCIYHMSANAHICLTLCEGDFCNGPLPPNESLACNESDEFATCGAGQLFVASGPFGPIVDRVLGRGYLVPLVAAILGVTVFG